MGSLPLKDRAGPSENPKHFAVEKRCRKRKGGCCSGPGKAAATWARRHGFEKLKGRRRRVGSHDNPPGRRSIGFGSLRLAAAKNEHPRVDTELGLSSLVKSCRPRGRRLSPKTKT